MQQSKSRVSRGFLVHLANVRTIGSSASLYDAYIVLSCSLDIFWVPAPQRVVVQHAGNCTLRQSSWGSSPKSFIHPLSQFPQDTPQNRDEPPNSLSVLPVFFALPLLIIFAFSFSQGMNLMGNNLGSNEVTSFLSMHMPDNECSSPLSVFRWTLHKHHRKSSNPIHT